MNTRKLASRKLFRVLRNRRQATSHLILWTNCQEEPQNSTHQKQMGMYSSDLTNCAQLLIGIWYFMPLNRQHYSFTPSRYLHLEELSGRTLSSDSVSLRLYPGCTPSKRFHADTRVYLFQDKIHCVGIVLDLQYCMQSIKNLWIRYLPVSS